ncbi:MAG: hypothetical protein BGO26_11635 [Actinobacteria bacterium 69-20]|jgi:putative cell wall-binding protein|nr:cell wall-binding repeat-containing protein [Actinomycetota bacterium]OJV26567.1 MAG: hypothetical protein BGO26_11635 [Actinobacteria bacterium 69-20]
MTRRLVAAIGGVVFAAAMAAAGMTSMTSFAANAAVPVTAVPALSALSGITPAVGVHAAAAVAPRPRLGSALPDRIAGADRYDTAAKIAAQFGPAGTVVVANGSTEKQGFDALSANFLAGVVGAPILLTGGASLPSATAASIKSVLQGSSGSGYQVLVMGKADSVSDAVVAQINAIVQALAGDKVNHVVRVAGSSRYDTAVAAATFNGDDPTGHWVGSYTIGDGSTLGKTAFLVSGASNADALAAGPISNALRIPVYLTPADALPVSVAGALMSQGIKNLIVLGGGDRVPDAVVAQAKAAGVATSVRIAGGDRYETASKLYDFARSTLADSGGAHYGSAGPSPVFLANGTVGFPDALAVGPLAAQGRAALLTTAAETLPPAAAAFLTKYASSVSGVTALGQEATVSAAVLAAAKAVVG